MEKEIGNVYVNCNTRYVVSLSAECLPPAIKLNRNYILMLAYVHELIITTHWFTSRAHTILKLPQLINSI